MSILGDYWRGGIPRELQLSRAERREVRRRADKRMMIHPRTLAIYWMISALPPFGLLVIIALAILAIENGYLLNPASPRAGLVFGLLGAGKFAGIALLFVGNMIAERRYHRPHLLNVLREMNYEVCVSCGYLLRGLGEDVSNCPECGCTPTPLPTGEREGNG